MVSDSLNALLHGNKTMWGEGKAGRVLKQHGHNLQPGTPTPYLLHIAQRGQQTKAFGRAATYMGSIRSRPLPHMAYLSSEHQAGQPLLSSGRSRSHCQLVPAPLLQLPRNRLAVRRERDQLPTLLPVCLMRAEPISRRKEEQGHRAKTSPLQRRGCSPSLTQMQSYSFCPFSMWSPM